MEGAGVFEPGRSCLKEAERLSVFLFFSFSPLVWPGLWLESRESLDTPGVLPAASQLAGGSLGGQAQRPGLGPLELESSG